MTKTIIVSLLGLLLTGHLQARAGVAAGPFSITTPAATATGDRYWVTEMQPGKEGCTIVRIFDNSHHVLLEERLVGTRLKAHKKHVQRKLNRAVYLLPYDPEEATRLIRSLQH